MRVLVSCGGIGRLGPVETSDTVAQAFAARGAQVAVAPVSAGGEGFAEIVRRFSPDAHVLTAHTLSQACDMLTEGADYLDVTAVPAPGLGELLALPVSPVHAGTTVVVPHRETGRTLTGLTGSLAERGRENEVDIAVTLEEDSRATAWLERLKVVNEAPAGALCGLGAWALGCGARVVSGIGLCVDGYRMQTLAAKADVIVTGAGELDFHHRGGDVVVELTRLGVEALRPVVVVAGRNFISPRELRLAGIEEAHAVTPPGVAEIDITAEQLGAVARRVAVTWTW